MSRPDWNLARRPFLETRRLDLFAGVLLGLSALLLWWNVDSWLAERHQGAAAERIAQQEAEIRRLSADAAAARETAEKAVTADVKLEVDFLNQLIRERTFSWVRMLARLERAVPDEVAISTIRPEFGRGQNRVRLSLAGISQDSEGFLLLLENLFADPAFSDPEPKAESSMEVTGNPEGREFSMTVDYDPDVDATTPPPAARARRRRTATPLATPGAPAGQSAPGLLPPGGEASPFRGAVGGPGAPVPSPGQPQLLRPEDLPPGALPQPVPGSTPNAPPPRRRGGPRGERGGARPGDPS